MNDLIERWKRIATETKEPTMYRVNVPDGKSWMADFLIETAEASIAALSPVLPEDVQEMIDSLRSDGRFNPNFLPIADLIERLARENASLHASMCNDPTYAGLQQRIEELGQVIARNHEHAKGLKNQIVEYVKRIEELENEIKHWESGKTVHLMQQRIEELEKPVLPEEVEKVVTMPLNAGVMVSEQTHQLSQVSSFLINRSLVATGEEIQLSKFCDEAADLIERLARENDILASNCKRCGDQLEEAHRRQYKLAERIEELEKPVLPEEIANFIESYKLLLEDPEASRNGLERFTIDLIERLARDRQTLISTMQRDDDNAAMLKQRIEELENAIEAMHEDTAGEDI